MAKKMKAEPAPATEVSLPYPQLDEGGALVGLPNAAVVAFLWAWIVQFIRVEQEDPDLAAELRAVFGFSPDKVLFNADAILPCQD